MIGKLIKKIRAFNTILKLSAMDPNDYSFGYRVRRIIDLYRKNKKIKENCIKLFIVKRLSIFDKIKSKKNRINKLLIIH